MVLLLQAHPILTPLGITLSVLYPLVIWLLVKKMRYGQESYRYLLAAFILGAVIFYLAYLRKFYVALFSEIPLYAVDLVTTGFIEEAAKLLILVIPFIRRRMDESNGAFYGLVGRFGFWRRRSHNSAGCGGVTILSQSIRLATRYNDSELSGNAASYANGASNG